MNASEQKFKTNIEYRLYRLRHFGKKHKWKENYYEKRILSFSQGKKYLLIDLDELRIQTGMEHPKHGITVLERKGDFTQKIIESIFRNPRQHMKKEKVKSEYVK